ncbi:outer membrane beta-barrel protein [Phenylobacterium sp.]|uniref:outer membrane beta-barrel protein n=1 Tax=Phenylobacterium sp. TaxID=1871053 RepID=UPI00374DE426
MTVATGGSAAAQVAPPPGGVGIPGGPPTTRTFTLEAQALVEHDSNLARTSESQAAASNVTPTDTIYAPTVNMNFAMPVGRQAVFFNASESYLFHQTNTRLNSNRTNLTGGGSLAAGPCSAVLRGGYSRGRSEVLGPATAQIGGAIGATGGTLLPGTTNLESTILNIETTEDAGLSLSCARASGIGINGQLSQQWTSNSETLSGSGSYRSTTGSAGATYQRPAFGALTVGGVYARTIYGDQVNAGLVPRGFETTGAQVSFNRQLGGRIQAQLMIGYTHAHDLSPPPIPAGVTGDPFADFSGFTYSGGASFRVTSRFQAKASFQRSISPSLLSGSSYEVLTGYGLDFQYQLGTHISLDLKGDRQQSRSNGAPLVVTAQTLTESSVNDLSASVSYRFNRRLSAQLSGTHETRKADNVKFAYDNDRIALTLSSTLF